MVGIFLLVNIRVGVLYVAMEEENIVLLMGSYRDSVDIGGSNQCQGQAAGKLVSQDQASVVKLKIANLLNAHLLVPQESQETNASCHFHTMTRKQSTVLTAKSNSPDQLCKEEWDECVPEDNIQAVKRTSVDGDKCVMPFFLVRKDEEKAMKGKMFPELGMIWWSGVCSIGRQSRNYGKTDVKDHYESLVDHCRFLFTYSGDLWVDCTELDGVETCKHSDGEWQEYEPRIKTEATKTPSKMKKSSTPEESECASQCSGTDSEKFGIRHCFFLS
ncbi:hypothetical protein BSKO_08187 [Bryopsis sp. KO-2023]|nr:hypothetical protein BSKO_08187 [Bryopsis sp. KO-2023]